MRLYLDGEKLVLDPQPYTARELSRTSAFKRHARRLLANSAKADGDAKLELTVPGNYASYIRVTERLQTMADKLGCPLEVDPELEGQYRDMRELAEEHYRLGNEIKRADPKLDERLATFSQVVSARMVRPLKDRQMRDAFFLAVMGRAGNFSVPGSGKTATVLGAFAYLAASNKVDRVVVVCPKNAFDSWKTEWRLCFGDLLPLSCATTQDADYRKLGRADRKRFFRAGVGGRNLILANYEATSSIADELRQLAATRTLLVFDEVHRVKQVGGKQAGAALTIASQAPYTFALTGTPLPNTYADLYNFLNILYPREYDNFFGFEPGELKRATDADQIAINKRIQPFFCRTTKADLGVPAADPDQIIDVDAGAGAASVLHALKARYRKNKLTLMLRVLQLEHNAQDLLLTLDPSEYRWLLEVDEEAGDVDTIDYSDSIAQMIRAAGPSPKRTRCIELAESLVNQGRPVIIWCIFTSSILGLKHDLAARGIETRTIYGNVVLDDRTRILDDFRAGTFPVLITNPHTLAESVSLHSICHDAIYYEYSFNLVHLLQSKDRIHRLGLPQDQRTSYHFLCQSYAGEGTGSQPYSMDREIYGRLCKKEETMLRAIDSDLIETQPTTQEDLDAIFAGLI